ncbi:hypothetical protein CDL15_Pgr026774 [Punica granatum]|uniref:Fatty acyl-CoA reductase n=1 Tax=Punica granatum TaxID=22663 RepID=A0A218WLH2_PUNGR|nr:hypothetical protein CDL15_Pgr026774 [Punica granatum]
MKLESPLLFLEHRTILVTGAAGFLAKIFLEKVLRVQPDVKKLYLLIRAEDDKLAKQRFQNEIIGKELFRVLKEKLGAARLNSLISEKVVMVPGDITCEDLGVKDNELIHQMWSQVDVIVNLAATTNFDERYDVALGVNTLGAKHVVEFAKKCCKLDVLVHVSTAYVSGEKGGLIHEKPYRMGETLNGASGLDIDAERGVVEERLKQLQGAAASDKATSIAMKELGIKRAKIYGWPNTYVFTKAMAEMLVGQLKGDMPVVILRPAIVTSTYKEPFPGWAEGVRTVDSLALGYGTGRLTCFLGDLNGVVDVIPADMVVNSIIVAMVAHANQRSDGIYQMGSSLRNPVRYVNLQDYAFHYFTENPWINKDGKPVKVGKVTVLKSMASFHRYMAIRYSLWLKGLELANAALCRSFQGTYTDLDRKIKFVMRLVELYRPYLFFKGVFDDSNTEKLRMAAKESGVETDIFYFDPNSIDWEDYVTNIHIPGIVKHVFK